MSCTLIDFVPTKCGAAQLRLFFLRPLWDEALLKRAHFLRSNSGRLYFSTRQGLTTMHCPIGHPLAMQVEGEIVSATWCQTTHTSLFLGRFCGQTFVLFSMGVFKLRAF